jgi:hypothetical protein
MSSTRVVRCGMSVLGAVALLTLCASTAAAQDKVVTVTGGLDFTNQYNFRGIRQNTEGMSTWPYVDFGFAPYKGTGAVKTMTVNVGTWNAINSQIDNFTNLDGEVSSNKWYESDFYATFGLGFGGGFSLGTTYTSYTSPGNWFSHVKEIAFKLSVDDSTQLKKASLKPYAVFAFELDDNGQADAGESKGTYIELGVAPGYASKGASFAVPIKVGLSANDYYEFGTGTDSTFGYFSIAAVVTVPLGPHMNVHGGAELQTYGDNLKAYNHFGDNGDSSAAGLYSIGLGFSF